MDGVLLINLGAPDSTAPEDLKRYLREFLSDPRVLDSPKLIRQAVLNFLILPSRPADAAHAYKQVWTEEGPPLVVSGYRQRDLLRERLDIPVELAMRYGNPSTASAAQQLVARGVDNIFVVPLYPHYAMSSYETAAVRALDEIRNIDPSCRVTIQPPFFADDDYIEALRQGVAPYLESEWDAVLFSYHGIPERHVRKGDVSRAWCLQHRDCCDLAHPAHATCYRAQAFATTRALAAAAAIPDDRWYLSFQSRLGRDPWLQPFTDHLLTDLPSRGVKRLLVLCPSFVSDCLETLEEIDIRGREDFMKAGGHSFTYIPCLNESPAWLDTLDRMVRDWRAGALQR